MLLAKLLGDNPVSEFLENHYLKLPFARPGGCLDLTSLGSWDAIERLLVQPGVDVIVGREGERWPGEGTLSAAEARRLSGEGYTIGIRHAHVHDAGLATLAAEFQQVFASPIDIHLYCTPAGQPGFGWHYDAEEVFVLQTHGDKEWWLRKNTVNPWPLVETIPADQRYEREIMPVMRCALAAGDWLYIPSGYWHKTQAGGESISLSVGVLAATGIDVFDFLRQRLLDSLRWRQRLPVTPRSSRSADEQYLQALQAHFGELGQDLAKLLGGEGLPQLFLDQRRVNQSGGTGIHDQ